VENFHLTQMPVCAFIVHMSFAELLREEIDRTGITVKRLARLVAEDTGIQAESARPLIYKYLRGEHEPDPPMRRALARALGRPPDFFDGIDWDFERALDLRVDGYFKRGGITVIA
jgi:transcriptional regulator with XRE-family HTH domain